MAHTNYQSMPGFGDLAGDSRHPGGPDHVEPAFDRTDAAGNVAKRYERDGEAGAVFEAVAEARALMDWVAQQSGLPTYLFSQFRDLDAQVKRVAKSVERELESLNDGPVDEILRGNADLESLHGSLGRVA